MAAVVVSIASGKGGVGKTTTVANLAIALGQQGLNVLTWDLDGQGNLGQALSIEAASIKYSSYHLMSGRLMDIGPAIHRTEFRGVSVIPAQMELFAAEHELAGSVGKEYIARTLLQQPEAREFDVVLLDLPPSLGFHTVNGFAASRFVLIPLQVSGFALSGLRQLAYAIRLAQQHLNPELELLGLLPTFVAERTRFSRDLIDAIHLLPDTRVFQPYIPYTVRVAEGSLTGVPVVASAPDSVAGVAYREVSRHVWEALRTAPAHVTRAPEPNIASPPRAVVDPVDGTSRDFRPATRPAPAAPAAAEPEAAPPAARRRSLFGWLMRSQRTPS